MSDYDDIYRQRGAEEAFRVAADDARKLRTRLADETLTLLRIEAEADAAGVPGCFLASWLRAVMAVVSATREVRSQLSGSADFFAKKYGLDDALAALDAEERDGEPAVREQLDPKILAWRHNCACSCESCEALDLALREAGL